MNNKDKPGNSAKKTTQKIKQIEEMYRQADQIYDGFAESESSSGESLDPTIHRLPEGPENGNIGTSSPEDNRDPTWLLGVLEDLMNFAEDQNLSELEDCLRDTYRKVARILAAKNTT